MRALTRALSAAALLPLAAVMLIAHGRDDAAALTSVLETAGERVLRYLARAQHIVCLEVVRLQPLTSGWSTDGFGRTVESELHLLWAPGEDGGSATDAAALRQVLRVNGHEPRENDRNNCTTPEQETREPLALALLLPDERTGYRFKMAGRTTVDRRAAIMVDFRLIKEVTVETKMVEGHDDCVSFDLEGGMEGRLWIDAETFDVLRVDQRLSGMVEIPLPKKA